MARPRPLIGITTYPPSQAGCDGLPHEQPAAVRRARGEPGLVPPELAGHPGLRSVQGHPELAAASDPTQRRLPDALAAAGAPTRTRGRNP